MSFFCCWFCFSVHALQARSKQSSGFVPKPGHSITVAEAWAKLGVPESLLVCRPCATTTTGLFAFSPNEASTSVSLSSRPKRSSSSINVGTVVATDFAGFVLVMAGNVGFRQTAGQDRPTHFLEGLAHTRILDKPFTKLQIKTSHNREKEAPLAHEHFSKMQNNSTRLTNTYLHKEFQLVDLACCPTHVENIRRYLASKKVLHERSSVVICQK